MNLDSSNDKFIICPLPFSTSFEPTFSLEWAKRKNESCCFFIIKVPFDYKYIKYKTKYLQLKKS